jgi:hypothetical protein
VRIGNIKAKHNSYQGLLFILFLKKARAHVHVDQHQPNCMSKVHDCCLCRGACWQFHALGHGSGHCCKRNGKLSHSQFDIHDGIAWISVLVSQQLLLVPCGKLS